MSYDLTRPLVIGIDKATPRLLYMDRHYTTSLMTVTQERGIIDV